MAEVPEGLSHAKGTVSAGPKSDTNVSFWKTFL
jgi:hypothetical protein